jgi:hypothetical protein
MSDQRAFPFVPKTNARLQTGDFWPLPLVDGSFACGRVLQLPPAGLPGSRVSFLGGLMDWHGGVSPCSTDLAGRGLILQTSMHVMGISRTCGGITGHRPLEADGTTPLLCVDGDVVRRGYTAVRSFEPSDRNLPLFSYSGWNLLWREANRHFLGHALPDDAEPAQL